MQSLLPYLGDIDHLTDESVGETVYVHPRLRNLGSVSVVTIREIVAPTVFRNAEAEITDIDIEVTKDGETAATRVIRAVPNKFKHRERGRGLQILRHFGAGGTFPQNRATASKDLSASQVFDLNSLVFGDSVTKGGKVFPVKAAVLYSDGLSLDRYEHCVAETFHNRGFEDGGLFDPEKKDNTSNIFQRHVIRPGTLLVQVLSTHGRLLPIEGLDHLLLSLSGAGSYGGQTSISGVNVRTHIAGVFASLTERAETSPYQIAQHVIGAGRGRSVEDAISAVQEYVAPKHELSISCTEASEYRDRLVAQLIGRDPALAERYKASAGKVADMFGAWFEGAKKGGAGNDNADESGVKAGRRSKKSAA
jgi:CRISPR type I-D-associated protein Csc2